MVGVYNMLTLLLLLVWHAPLGVRSAKCQHQSPEWTILSHSYRLIQGEIVRPQVEWSVKTQLNLLLVYCALYYFCDVCW